MRTCGACRLCCIIPPHPAIEKPGCVRCTHLSNARGCTIYEDRPRACRDFRCQWLANYDAEDIPRPDRGHFLIDPAPDMVTSYDKLGVVHYTQAVQIWVDPKYPDAWKHPALLRFLARRGHEGIVAIIRYGTNVGDFILAPPNLSGTGKFLERRDAMQGQQSAVPDMVEKLGMANLRVCL
jgi:hypothetical protein